MANQKIIGIDIGGTNIRGVFWDEKRKKVLKYLETKTPKSLADFKSAILKIIKHLGKADAIAIAVAGVVEGKMLVKSPNIPYAKNLDFSFVGKHFSARLLDNDARCFALAEYKLGSAKGKKSAFFVTVGTGVGRAFGKNGKVLKIKKFEYPETWEQEYQKVRDAKNYLKLADYVAGKIETLASRYHPEIIVVGGGIARRKDFFKRLKEKMSFSVKRQKLYLSSAIGAALLVK